MSTTTNEYRPSARRRANRRRRDLRAGDRAAHRHAEPAELIRPPSSTASCAIGWSGWPRRASTRSPSPRRSRATARPPPRSTPRWRSARADATASSSSTPICAARASPRCWGCAPTRGCATWSPAGRRSTTACGASATTSCTCCRRATCPTICRTRYTTRAWATFWRRSSSASTSCSSTRRRCCRWPTCRRCARDLDGAIMVVRANSHAQGAGQRRHRRALRRHRARPGAQRGRRSAWRRCCA